MSSTISIPKSWKDSTVLTILSPIHQVESWSICKTTLLTTLADIFNGNSLFQQAQIKLTKADLKILCVLTVEFVELI